MFGVQNLKHTRYAQELLAEGRAEGELLAKLQLIPALIERGFTVEQIAQILELDIEQVRGAYQA